MTLSKYNPLPKFSPPRATTVRIKASTREFCEDLDISAHSRV